jgi:hypothetical protein
VRASQEDRRSNGRAVSPELFARRIRVRVKHSRRW